MAGMEHRFRSAVNSEGLNGHSGAAPRSHQEPMPDEALAESPMTKQLNRERIVPVQEPLSASVNFLTRPQSHGNATQPIPFLPPPKPNASQGFHIARSLAFAPLGAAPAQTRAPSPKPLQSGERVRSASPLQSPCRSSKPTHARAQSVPRIPHGESRAKKTTMTVTISSDDNAASLEHNDHPFSSEKEIDGSLKASKSAEATSGTKGPEDDILPHSQINQTPESSPYQANISSTSLNGNFSVENETESASEHVVTAADPRSGTQKAPRRQQNPLLLTQPARIAKTRVCHLRNPTEPRNRPDQTSFQGSLPSDNDLMFVVLHRLQHSKESARKLDVQVKRLENRVFELIRANSKLQDERDTITANLNELGNRNDVLRAKIDNFTARYTKIKTFAKEAHTQLLSLRKSGDGQKELLQSLVSESAAIKTSVQQAQVQNEETNSALGTQRRSLGAIHSLTQRTSNDMISMANESKAKSQRITEIQREKVRLETHIMNLQHSKQRSDQNAREALSEVSTNVRRLTAKVADIRDSSSTATGLEQNPTLENIAFILFQLLRGRENDYRQIADLSENVRMFQHAVVQVAQGFNGPQKALLEKTESVHMQKILEEVKKHCQNVLSLAQTDANSAVARTRLEGRLETSMKSRTQLQESLLQANAYAVSFQKGMERVLSTSEQQAERESQLRSERDRFQLRWNCATSELAAAKGKLLQQEREIIDRRDELEAQEIFSEICLREERARRRHLERLLEKEGIKLAAEIGENDRAVDAAHRMLLSSDDEYALLAQAYETLQREYERATTTNLSTKNAKSSTEATIRFLRSRIESLELENKVGQGERKSLGSPNASLISISEELRQSIKTLSKTQFSLQSTNSKLQRDKQNLEQQFNSVQEQRDSALKDAEDAKRLVQQLQRFQSLYESSTREVAALMEDSRKFGILQTKFDSLNAENVESNSKLSGLREKLAQASEYPALVEELNAKVSGAKVEHQKLEGKLRQAFMKGDRADELEKELASKTELIRTLQGELDAQNKVEQQFEATTKAKDRLSKALTLVQKDLDDAQQQLEANGRLSEQLKGRDEEIHELRQQADRVPELSQQLAARNEELKAKDADITTLRAQTERNKRESQATIQNMNSNSIPALNELDFPTQQTNISFFQSQQSQTENKTRESNRNEADEINDRPQRKAADRSGFQGSVRFVNLPNGSQASSTGSTDFVPNSQLDPAVGNNGRSTGLFEIPEQSRSTSPLTELNSDNIAAIADVKQDEESHEPEIPETLQHDMGLDDIEAFSPTKRSNTTVRPSSAMTEDLFKQHAKNLDSGNDLGPQGAFAEIQDSVPRHGHPVSIMRSTVNSQNVLLNQGAKPAISQTRFKQYGNGTGFEQRMSTPGPPAMATPTVQTTPASDQSRHQPNSAIKRSAEGIFQPTKRLRRDPQVLENSKTTLPKKANPFAQPAENKSSASSSRKGGSIVGTSAPVPGKTPKVAKPKRKNPKNDKYAHRFKTAT